MSHPPPYPPQSPTLRRAPARWTWPPESAPPRPPGGGPYGFSAGPFRPRQGQVGQGGRHAGSRNGAAQRPCGLSGVRIAQARCGRLDNPPTRRRTTHTTYAASQQSGRNSLDAHLGTIASSADIVPFLICIYLGTSNVMGPQNVCGCVIALPDR